MPRPGGMLMRAKKKRNEENKKEKPRGTSKSKFINADFFIRGGGAKAKSTNERERYRLSLQVRA